jgi:tetratricopeptide (TPR) repeat protein
MNTVRIRIFPVISSVCLWLACFGLGFPGGAFAASDNGATNNTNTNNAAAQATDSTISNDTLRVYLQLQEQIREAQLAIERTRRESESAAVKNAELLANRLSDIERSVAAQREAMQSTGKFMLTVLGIFAGTGFLGIVLTAYFQWRTVSRLTDSAPRPAPTRDLLPAIAALGTGESQLMVPDMARQTNTALLGAVERLEKRLRELERAVRLPLAEPVEKNGDHPETTVSVDATATSTATTSSASIKPETAARIKQLLDDGQALLNQDKVPEAIEHFDEALQLDPNSTDALVKKGTALEKMRKLTEAIECYDRAIALDGSMTIAYLYKGGLYNRMERFSEAVECYEQALRTQEKRDVN